MTDHRYGRRDFVKRTGVLAGAMALRHPFDGWAGDLEQSAIEPPPGGRFPTLNPRARGWLRFLWEKTTTSDDWSRHGRPHSWWDVYSVPGVQSYGRFDLQYSSYALLLMADQTPAWREIYTRIADGLASRFPTYWGAIDWLTQIGNDPNRKRYSDAERALLPPQLHGKYNRVGWTANGVKPWGLQQDPIGADGYLFFRGWFNLVLSIYKYVSGDNKWERPFQVIGYRDRQFEWDHARIADRLAQQYAQRPEGPHCENTKIWFFCNSAAALGLYLYDHLHGTQTYRAIDNFLEYARREYMSVSRTGQLEWVTRYYDPLVGYKANVGPQGGIDVAFHLLPQQPELARFLYEAAANTLGWRDLNRPPSSGALPLVLAREMGDDDVALRFRAAADRANEPRFFGDHDEMFGWFFQLNERYPRGQQSAMMMVADVAEPGAWTRVFSAPHLDKFQAPTVEGIDYPSLGVSQAWNDSATGTLHVVTYPVTLDRRGLETTWIVTKLPNTGGVSIVCDGEPFSRFDVIGNDRVRMRTTVDSHYFQIRTNVRDVRNSQPDESPGRASRGVASHTESGRHGNAVLSAGADLLAGGGPTCPCCLG